MRLERQPQKTTELPSRNYNQLKRILAHMPILGQMEPDIFLKLHRKGNDYVRDWLNQALEPLDSEQRNIITHRLNLWSHKQIARYLGLSPTKTTRIEKEALQTLEKKIERKPQIIYNLQV